MVKVFLSDSLRSVYPDHRIAIDPGLQRLARLPANLLQAQRDFFGAHTYERTDKPAGEFFHTQWPDVVTD